MVLGVKIEIDDKFISNFFERYSSVKGMPALGDIIIVMCKALNPNSISQIKRNLYCRFELRIIYINESMVNCI